jgi:hypothetical protein
MCGLQLKHQGGICIVGLLKGLCGGLSCSFLLSQGILYP